MARCILNDDVWKELKVIMKKHGCHQWENDRNVIEAIL